ncbi:hypothetical protein JXB37_06185, partial [candidate division WOR-3 bacterium]|nr:hypothetical protein [candidate division WOR-3 bacterium]
MSSPVRFILALALLATMACDEPTGPPTINWVRGPGAVFANDNIEVEGEAWDWGLAAIEFSWSCPSGSLVLLEQSRTYSKVRWFAPESSGKTAVRLLVTDLDGETARDSLAVEVRRRTVGLLDYSGEVKAGLFRQWPESLRTGYRVRGEFA